MISHFFQEETVKTTYLALIASDEKVNEVTKQASGSFNRRRKQPIRMLKLYESDSAN